jgi:hypothetical protein
MRKASAITIAGFLALTGCGPSDDDILFDGQFYNSKVRTERSARDEFVVTTRPVSASLLGAREAARYEATVYCVNRYGRSDIIWTISPDDPDEQLPISDDTLTLSGRCPQ